MIVHMESKQIMYMYGPLRWSWIIGYLRFTQVSDLKYIMYCKKKKKRGLPKCPATSYDNE